MEIQMRSEEMITRIRAYLVETWLDGDTPLLEVLWPLSGGGTVPVELTAKSAVRHFDPAKVPLGAMTEALSAFDIGIQLETK